MTDDAGELKRLAAAARRLSAVEGVRVVGERSPPATEPPGRSVHASLRAFSSVAFPQEISIDRDDAYGTLTFLPYASFEAEIGWMAEDAEQLREDLEDDSSPEEQLALEAASSGVPFAFAGDQDLLLVLPSGTVVLRGGEGPEYRAVADDLASLLADGIAVAFRVDGRECEAFDRAVAEATGLPYSPDNRWVAFWRRLRRG